VFPVCSRSGNATLVPLHWFRYIGSATLVPRPGIEPGSRGSCIVRTSNGQECTLKTRVCLNLPGLPSRDCPKTLHLHCSKRKRSAAVCRSTVVSPKNFSTERLKQSADECSNGGSPTTGSKTTAFATRKLSVVRGPLLAIVRLPLCRWKGIANVCERFCGSAEMFANQAYVFFS